MKEFLTSFIDWFSINLLLIKSVSIFISGILLVGIIYLISKLQFINYRVEIFMDAWSIGDLNKHRSLRAWKHILKHLSGRKEERWKQAVLDADKVLDELLKISGYHGAHLTERLDNITSAQITNIDELRQAHETAKIIKKDPDFAFSKTEAEENVYIYRKVFKELRLLE